MAILEACRAVTAPHYYLNRMINVEEVTIRSVIVIQVPFGKYEDGDLNLSPSSFTVSGQISMFLCNNVYYPRSMPRHAPLAFLADSSVKLNCIISRGKFLRKISRQAWKGALVCI